MISKKQYIIITPYFPSEFSHVGSYIYDQAKAINKTNDFAVKVIKVVSIFSKESDYIFNDIQVVIFKVIDFPFFIFPGVFNWFNSIRIRKFLEKKNIINNLYVVHAHVCYLAAYLANAINIISRVKRIVQHHGIDALQLLNGRFGYIRRLQYNFIKNRSIKQLNEMELNVSVSKRVENELHTFESYSPKNEYVLYNGVDRTKFYNMNLVKSTDFFYVGCIANFWEIKDQISLIQAIEILIKEGVTDIFLKLLGSGEKLDYCRRYVNDNNLTNYIHFEKERKHRDLNIFYNSLDLFVLPSYYEASACVLMEAWATDLPIISIKNQGFAELIPINEKKNLLAEKKSPISLKEKIFNEYQRNRIYPFDAKYDIKNTIHNFLLLDIFERDVERVI